MRYAIDITGRTGSRLTVVHALEDMNAEDPLIAAGQSTRRECWREVGPAIGAEYERLLGNHRQAPEGVELMMPEGVGSEAILESFQKGCLAAGTGKNRAVASLIHVSPSRPVCARLSRAPVER